MQAQAMSANQSKQDAPESVQAEAQPKKQLSPAAERALAEAAERRRLADAARAAAPTEINGRGGLDPSRFGDWEIDGRAVDF
jgi:hypothetical protein